MTEVFGDVYSAAYDAFYAEKDYEGECDVIERALQEYSTDAVRRVIDLGCGTGGHAIPLARRGYEVLGVDRADGMLAVARAKARAAAVLDRVTLFHQDVTSVAEVAPCDAALMMFNVLGYQASSDNLRAALGTVRRALRPGGLFLFDVWHAAAVEHDPPAQRWQMTNQDGVRVVRLSSGRLDRAAELCTVSIRMLLLKADQVFEEAFEEHRMRYFTHDSLEKLLKDAGMELLRVGRFPDYWHEPDSQRWSVLGVARAAA